MTRSHHGATLRPTLSVKRDQDGNVTVHDPQSGVVLSIRHPNSHTPSYMVVDIYPYPAGHQIVIDPVPARGVHPTYTIRIEPRGDET